MKASINAVEKCLHLNHLPTISVTPTPPLTLLQGTLNLLIGVCLYRKLRGVCTLFAENLWQAV